MRINSLTLSGILSFGPEQTLDSFTNFNLFIGQNGSGKSNVLKVLAGLPFDIYMDPNKSTILDRYGNPKHVNVFIPAVHELANTVINHDAKKSDIRYKLEIVYEQITNVNQNAPLSYRVFFDQSRDGLTLDYIEGNVFHYASRASLVKIPETDHEIFKDIALNVSGQMMTRNILNFGLFYIFRQNFRFSENGTFVQGKLGRGGPVESELSNLPSGVSQFIKCMTRILMAWNASVILIDEPELHLEPRFTKRFFEFLVWYSVRSNLNSYPNELKVFEKVESVLDEYRESGWIHAEDFQEKFGNTLQGKQFFIASHSPVLINEFLKLEQAGSIYEFTLKNLSFTENYSIQNQTEPVQESLSLFSNVRQVQHDPEQILNHLGSSGADILQCNGVIWVEGPSDVIYIKKWLAMFAHENDCELFTQGVDFEFQMYGGTLLDSLSLIKIGEDPSQEHRKLVSMFSFSRNAYVVIDSDAIKNEDGKIIDQSNFFNAKNYIKSQMNNMNSDGYKVGIWFDEGNTEIRTIEDYLDENSKKAAPKSLSKKIRAQKISESWGKTKTLSDFKSGLRGEIAKLYNLIKSWQE